MPYSISDARKNLSTLCTKTQDPREVIVLTRHGKPIAALVSIAEAKRIWDLGDTERLGWLHPLAKLRGRWSEPRIPGMEPGANGAYTTPREAAQQVREIQMTRAEERRILKRGGLDPVEGGELGETVPWWRTLWFVPGWVRQLWHRA